MCVEEEGGDILLILLINCLFLILKALVMFAYALVVSCTYGSCNWGIIGSTIIFLSNFHIL